MELKNATSTKSSQRIKEMVQIALMTALTYIAVSYLNIPNGMGGVVHLGDSIIFITAVIFGARQAAISGAIGMTMFDALFYPIWAPYTFVIKAVMGIIVGFAARSGNAKGNSVVRNAIGIIVAGIFAVAGYYAAEAIMVGNIYTPIQSLVGNIIQVSGSGLIALILIQALKRTRYFNE